MKRTTLHALILVVSLLSVPAMICGQTITELFPRYQRNTELYDLKAVNPYTIFASDTLAIDSVNPDLVAVPEVNELFFDGNVEIDEEGNVETDSIPELEMVKFEYIDFNPFPLATTSLRPTVFDSYHMLDPLPLGNSLGYFDAIDPYTTEWLTRANDQESLLRQVRQRYILDHPELVVYNESHLPAPPKKFTATVDPATASILLKEEIPTHKEIETPELKATFGKRHWLRKFTADLQFSQAYVSPNWYQGGNNNLNALLNLYYNVKLNPAFHEKLLFENTWQYKLGFANAPDDEYRDYSISQDLFQWNMTAGYKSTSNWYYTVNSQFKTQMLSNYKPNTETLKAAFMSPGELNVGVGMTYNHTNKKKTFTIDASISPLSYNLKVVRDNRLNVKSYGIEEGHHSVSEYGSSGEVKLSWQIAENISLRSRLFSFTDYDYIQSDLENTISFTINRFLTTQILVHMRFDSSSPVVEDTDWHKFMMREVLSFGFTYNFSTI